MDLRLAGVLRRHDAPDPALQDWDFEVLREWGKLDLVVCVPGRRPLVVENKTFSLLDEDQRSALVGASVASD